MMRDAICEHSIIFALDFKVNFRSECTFVFFLPQNEAQCVDALSLDLDKVFFCYVKIMGPGIPGELLHFVGLYTILGPYIQFQLSETALYGPVRCCTVL